MSTEFNVSKFKLMQRNLPGVVFWALGTLVLAWVCFYSVSEDLFARFSKLPPVFSALGVVYVLSLLGMVFDFWWTRRAYASATGVLWAVVLFDASSGGGLLEQEVKTVAVALATLLLCLLYLKPMVATLGFGSRGDVARLPFSVILQQLIGRPDLIHEQEWLDVFKDTLVAHGPALREASRDWGMLKASRFAEEIEALLQAEPAGLSSGAEPFSDAAKDGIWAFGVPVVFMLCIGLVHWIQNRVADGTAVTSEVNPTPQPRIDWKYEMLGKPELLETIPPDQLDEVLSDHGLVVLEELIRKDPPGLWAPAIDSYLDLSRGNLKRLRQSNPNAGVMWLRNWIKQPLRSQMLIWQLLGTYFHEKYSFNEEGKAVFGDPRFIGQQWQDYCQFLKGQRVSSHPDAGAFLKALKTRSWFIAFRKSTPPDAIEKCDISL